MRVVFETLSAITVVLVTIAIIAWVAWLIWKREKRSNLVHTLRKHFHPIALEQLVMRRSAQYCLERGGGKALSLQDVDRALDEIFYAGGSLNLKLLGGAERVDDEAN